MHETSEKVEEFKARARARYPRQNQQNFRIPWYVLVVNVLLIVYILFMFSRREGRENPEGTVILYRNVEYRLSFVRDRTSGENVAALSLRSRGERPVSIRFRGALATLEFYQGGKLVAGEKIGGGVSGLTLNPGETRTYVSPVPVEDIRLYSRSSGAVMAPAKRSLVSTESRHMPLSAWLTLNTDDTVATMFEFRFYEVD